MKTLVGYHGTNAVIESVDSIVINFNSSHQFYGPAFYIALNRELAENFGEKIYKISFAVDNLFKVDTHLQVGTFGLFKNFLNHIREEKFDSGWSETKIENYIENNQVKFLQEYIEIQKEIKDDFAPDYDGILDNNQVAVFFPQKVIQSFQRIF